MLSRGWLVVVLLAAGSSAWLERRGAEHQVDKREQKCLQDLGCFATSDVLTNLPMDPDQLQTQFLLYTRQNRQTSVDINATMDEVTWGSLLDASDFDPQKETKFIIHGFSESGRVPWVNEMKDSLLTKGDFNVIAVSWPNGARQLNPELSAANVFMVAAELAKFIKYLVARGDSFTLDRVHVIGFSFGAQIAGNTGSLLQGRLSRISGLDPAEPVFIRLDNSMRLDKSDARLVDVIHSDAEDFEGIQGYGMALAVGHIDFYPNGGIDQPGCSDDLFLGLAGLLGGQRDANLACSHSRAAHFFIESISSSGCRFTAFPCASWDVYRTGQCKTCNGICPVMGYDVWDVSPSARGSYYLTTTIGSPYCGYEYSVEMDLTENVDENSFGRLFLTIHGDHDSQETEFSRDDNRYRAGTHESHMVAVHERVGHVSGVEVRYHRKTGLGVPRGTDPFVYLHNVTVRDTLTGVSYTFCADDAQLQDDVPQTFTSTSGC